MIKKRLLLLVIMGYRLFFIGQIIPKKQPMTQKDAIFQQFYEVREKMTAQNKYVSQYVLDNGMTILVRPVHTIPKVSVQLWYNVGSKDETDGERGIAHLIEHMIFKGTKRLSESDINVITHMLSGNCNAFTSYDFTGYLFNLPSHHWEASMNIMADCMENCVFTEDMLSSEMKAVIQELKMFKDKYVRSLVDEKIGMIFADHPYHHPIIGYKQDLWTVSSDDLKAFYKKHYKPNNAALVVVGDVNPEEVFKKAQKYFGHIKPDKNYKKAEFYFNQDIASKSITLYRDIKQPTVVLTFVVPGSREKKDHLIALTELILGQGKSSRLYKKIVNELQLATSLSVSSEELFDHGLFFIAFEPKTVEDIATIEMHIQQELQKVAKEGISDEELTRAIKQTKMHLYDLLEDNESQAYEIGKYFLATGDPDYVFNYLQYPESVLKQGVNELISRYLRPAVMHKGTILPLPESEREQWVSLQKDSDEEDNKILSARIRTTPIEPPSYAKNIQIKKSGAFDFPKAKLLNLSNGMKLLYYHNDNTPKIDIELEFMARSYYDPENKQGLYNFVAKMLTEGTKKYSGQELADVIESKGMSVHTYPGGISMSLLAQDLEFGLGILHEIVINALFDTKEIEKIRTQILAHIKNFWDEPRLFGGYLIKKELYKGHPYSKNALGTKESIENITQQDLMDFYNTYFTPHGAKIAIVGDLSGYNLEDIVQKKLGDWQKPPIDKIEFPVLAQQKIGDINYPINRDQVMLCFAGLSIDRKHPDFDKLTLFDQIFGGGVLGSMNSRLFQLRERSGLFYGINGSLIAGSNEQPGMVLVKTLVSLDRLNEAEKVIKETVDTTVDSILEQEVDEAKNAVTNALVGYFSSNSKIAYAFLFLDRYNFPQNYFDMRAQQLEKVSLADIKQAVKKVLNSKKLMVLRIGRLSENKEKLS